MRRHRVKMASLAAPGRYSFVGGPFGSKLTSTDYVAEGVPVIRGANMGGPSRFIDGDFVFVSDSKADTLLSNMAYPGDLVFTQRGTLGQIAMVPPATDLGDRFVVSQSQMKLTVDPTTADPRYLYYHFTSAEIIEDLKARAITSGVPHINLTILRDFEVELPDVGHQRRIADILSAYDDLIENNNRRMALLEESTHLLYREWFVYLRFPGHERVEVVDGVPEGWTKTTIGEVCAVFDGPHATPKTSDEGPVFLGIKNITPSGRLDLSQIRHISETEFPRWTRRVTPRAGDVVFTYEATLHRYAVIPAGFRGCLGRRMGLLRPRNEKVDASFLFPMLRSPAWTAYMETEKLQGATVDRISIKKFPTFRMLLPSKPVLDDFVSMSKEALAQHNNLRDQNQKLREARDLLLPRLMDGRIPV